LKFASDTCDFSQRFGASEGLGEHHLMTALIVMAEMDGMLKKPI
jgi:hypothetical protein